MERARKRGGRRKEGGSAVGRGCGKLEKSIHYLPPEVSSFEDVSIEVSEKKESICDSQGLALNLGTFVPFEKGG